MKEEIRRKVFLATVAVVAFVFILVAAPAVAVVAYMGWTTKSVVLALCLSTMSLVAQLLSASKVKNFVLEKKDEEKEKQDQMFQYVRSEIYRLSARAGELEMAIAAMDEYAETQGNEFDELRAHTVVLKEAVEQQIVNLKKLTDEQAEFRRLMDLEDAEEVA